MAEPDGRDKMAGVERRDYSIGVRQERESDRRAVETLVRVAFWDLYQPGADEHYIVHIGRGHPDCLKELSLVAELGGRLAGYIMYTRSRVLRDDGSSLDTLTFGPLAVHPACQGRGVGGALVARSFELASQLAPAVIILGYPSYYERLGFRPASDFGIHMGDGVCPKALQVFPFREDALRGGGKYEESPLFNVDAAAVAAFDKSFEPRTRHVTRSQHAFAAMQNVMASDPVPEGLYKEARDTTPLRAVERRQRPRQHKDSQRASGEARSRSRR